MGEKLARVFNTHFDYTEKQMKVGIENVRGDLQRFRAELERGDNERMKDRANQAIPSLEKTLKYVDERTPAQMIRELGNIHGLITTLEEKGATKEEIGDALLDRYRDKIVIYQPIFNRGWIETALQTIAAARTRRDM